MKNNNLNNLNSSKNVSEILEKLNREIFDEKIWIWEKMRKIAEVTYSYDNTQKINWKEVSINATLFSEIWWLDLKNFWNLRNEEKIKNLKISALNLISKIEEKKEKILKNIEELENIFPEKENEIYKKEIILKALKEKINLFDYCLNWLPFELEKAWIKQDLTEKEIFEINEKQKNLDKFLFWWEVKENKEEVKIVYKKILEDFLKNKEKLTEEEQEKYLFYLKKVENILENEEIFEEEKVEKPESLLKNFSDKKVERKDYIEYFQNSVNKTWWNYKVSVNDEVWSISDWPNSIEFPNKKEFDTLALPRVLKLEQHEILTHCITDLNNSKILWNLRWANSTEKDEGLAIFMENILEFGNWLLIKDEKSGKMIFDLKKFNLPQNIAWILMWEVLTNEELKDFLNLQEKMWVLNNSPKERFLRLKRSNIDWVQHKDTTYYRGLVKLVEEINKNILSSWKEGLSFYDFFIGKCDFEDTKKMLSINEIENNWKFTRPNFSPDETIFILNWWKISDKKEFLKYLREKYPFINFIEEEVKISKKDIQNALQKK